VADYIATLTGSDVTLAVLGKEYRFVTGTIGAHWAATSASVLAVCHALGLDIEKTANALAEFSELSGRGSLHMISVDGKPITLVDDSYNASPAAMRAAFAKLKELKDAGACKGRVIAALGDMRELGDSAPSLHSELQGPIAASGIDTVFTAGPNMKYLHDALPANLRGEHAVDAKSLIPVLRASLKVGDLVLVKGSHGSHMYEVAEALLAGEGEKRHAV
jgi:UDP-N-acetylmuramoyl-tripeptide--D-alanyl-D-alanine ligase